MKEFYDFMKKICDKIFVTSRKDKKVIISLLYKRVNICYRNEMKQERVQKHSSKCENVVNDKDGIFKSVG